MSVLADRAGLTGLICSLVCRYYIPKNALARKAAIWSLRTLFEGQYIPV